MNDRPSDESIAIQEELERQLGLRGADGRPVLPVDLERTAFVCAGSPTADARRNGAAARVLRRVVFKLTRWYVEPFVVQQRAFNLTLIRYIAQLERRIDELEARGPSEPR